MKFNFLKDDAGFIYSTHYKVDSKKENIIILGMDDIVPTLEIENNRLKEIKDRGIVLRCGYFKQYKDEPVIENLYKKLSYSWFDRVHREHYKLEFNFLDDYCFAKINNIEVIKNNINYIEFLIYFDIKDGIFISSEVVETFEVENNKEININNGMLDVDYSLEIIGENKEITDVEFIIDKYTEMKDVLLFSFKNINTLKVDLYNQKVVIDGVDKVEEFKDVFNFESCNTFRTLSKRLNNGSYKIKIKINNNNFKGVGVLKYTPLYIL